MIQVINYPAENRYLLDGNNTQITVISTNGAGYYFRAKIYIDDELFDEQGWSRKDEFEATKDLIYIYHAYFKPYFLGAFDTGLFENADFKKKVTIVIEERLIDTDAVVDSVTLPNFYLMYNVKSENFNDANKVYVLGLDPNRFRMKKTGTIAIPFYVNADDETVSVVVKDDLNNILHQSTLENVTGKKVFQYYLNLSEVTLLSSALYLTAEVTCGTETITKVYSLISLPNYEVKEVVFQNNFGFYIPAYFDGDFEDKRGFAIQSYERANNSEAVFAVDETATYTLNSGGNNREEKEIIRQIANSLDCYFKNGTDYLQVITGTKKATYDKSRLNIFAEDLTFTFRVGLPFTNDLTLPDITPTLEITNITTLDNRNFQIAFTSNFTMLQLFNQYRLNDTQTWSNPVQFAGTTSDQVVNVPIGTVSFQNRILAYYNGELIYSNIYDIEIIYTLIVEMPSTNTLSFSKTLSQVDNQGTASYILTEALIFNGYNNTEIHAYSKIRILTLPSNGNLTISGTNVFAPSEITLASISSGNLAFWPTGSDGSQPYVGYVTSFNYLVIDANDNESEVVNFEITFNTI